MSRHRSKRPCRIEVRDIEVYCILFPETNQVFIGKNLAPNHYQSYKDHVRGRKPLTKDLFEAAKQTGNYPKMYLLNRLQSTETYAYRYIVAWTKFFVDKGFQVLGHTKTLDYATDLVDETQKIFDEFKGFSLSEITSEEKILVGNYTQKTTDPEKIPTKIVVVVSPEEYLHIKAKADAEYMSLSKYCRLIAVNGTITRIEFTEYTDELRSIKRVLKEVALGIYQTGKYFPADIENFEKMLDKINDNYKKTTNMIGREFKKLQKLKLGK